MGMSAQALLMEAVDVTKANILVLGRHSEGDVILLLFGNKSICGKQIERRWVYALSRVMFRKL